MFTPPETKPVFFSKTFLSRGTTISAAPPPLCPCAALKGFPSWRFSWWWGLSVYYWVFCFPNSLPEVASPLFEHAAWHAGSVSWRKKKKQGTWMHPPNAHLLSIFKLRMPANTLGQVRSSAAELACKHLLLCRWKDRGQWVVQGSRRIFFPFSLSKLQTYR